MQSIDEKFMTILRKTDIGSFYKAHALLSKVSIPTLEMAANELCSRSEYYFKLGSLVEADNALQFASQIEGMLKIHGQNTDVLGLRINNMM